MSCAGVSSKMGLKDGTTCLLMIGPLVVVWLPSVIATVCNWSHVPPCPSSTGVADELDCFRPFDKHQDWRCVWKGRRNYNSSIFTLLIEPPPSNIIKPTCKRYSMAGVSYVSIGKPPPKPKGSMTAYVAGKTDSGEDCTMANFTGSPAHMIRCGVLNVELKREFGQLHVNASWDVGSDIAKYMVNYRGNTVDNSGNTLWMKEESQNRHVHVVKSLNSSVSYQVQVQCVSTSKCTQCAKSQVFVVPQELSREPIIKHVGLEPHQGRRKVTITWESPSPLGVSKHHVRVRKASKEFDETFTIGGGDSSVTLLLSHSAYEVSLHSSNNVSQTNSTPSWAIAASLQEMKCNGAFSVAFISNGSFSLSWSDLLAVDHECYTLEWFLKEDNTTAWFQSFSSYENHTTIDIEEGTLSATTLYPYKRYVFLLHVKQDKDDTCNLKQINASDITCGWAEAYLQEGTPIAAPQNVSQSAVTDSTAVVSWQPVPEEELRGFLRGYVVHIVHDGTASNVTVGPGVHRCELSDLRSRSSYQVEVAAITSQGEGARSVPLHFETSSPDLSSWIVAGAIIGTLLLLVGVNFCFRLLNRFKAALWPIVPNPGNSSVMQKTDREYELEVLEPASGLKMCEDWDSGPLYILDYRKEEVKHAAASPLLGKLRHDKSDKEEEEEEDQEEAGVETPSTRRREEGCVPPHQAIWVENTDQTLLEGSREDMGLEVAGTVETPLRRTNVGTPMSPTATATATATSTGSVTRGCDPKPAAGVFMGDYTTMELFQQASVASTQAECQPCQPCQPGGAVAAWPSAGASVLDYVHQSHFTVVPSPSLPSSPMGEQGTRDTAITTTTTVF